MDVARAKSQSPVSMHADMNVTPFLDILLVLLILFMFLCMNQQKIITAHVPDPSPPTTTVNTPPIMLEVLPNSSYAINTQPVSGDVELASRLRRIYDGRPTKTIMVRGGRGVRYQDIVTAVDIARGAGVVAIGLAPNR